MKHEKGDSIRPHIRLHKPDFRNFLDVYIMREIVGVKQECVTVLPFEEYSDPTVASSCMTLNAESAQRLMDDLWNCGLRPSEGSGSAGAMKATQNHLADLKKILFHKLEIDK